MVSAATARTGVLLLEVSVVTAGPSGGGGGGAGDGAMAVTKGCVTTASTETEAPPAMVTPASMLVALVVELNAEAIVDCSEADLSVRVWMVHSAMTLPA